MIPRWMVLAMLSAASLSVRSLADSEANRLTYLDGNDPFHPNLSSPRLTTPQWVGEPAVDAVVILAIDDMRDTPKYESFLRPILDRLKQIDGRAPVSIFCNQLDPRNPQLQSWLNEGLSFEVHTMTHPCPLLASSNFVAAAANYHDCVDLLNGIPGNVPLAFRMPCCDSMNSPSPRFYAEVFNRVSSQSRFLTMDSSVMNILTSADTRLPRELVVDATGRERFRKYFPAETNQITRLSLKGFGTTIENYPYPYVIGRLCWEFPAMAPSDWEAQNTHGTNNPITVADWKAALDATVLKQGVFTFIFHPHGWIRPAQLVEFIDYAAAKYGGRVKFLNFHEAGERLDRHLLQGQPLRAKNGDDNGVRLLDLNDDGFVDVVIGNEQVRKTRLWDPKSGKWADGDFPVKIVSGVHPPANVETGVRFGVMPGGRQALAMIRNERESGAWQFEDTRWIADATLLAGLDLDSQPILTSRRGEDAGLRLRDVDGDGRSEVIISNPGQNAVFARDDKNVIWKPLPFALPNDTSIVDDLGRDNGLRFVDVNDDGHDDVLFSNDKSFALHLYITKPMEWLGWERGWTFKVIAGLRDGAVSIPRIVRGGAQNDNGVWFHERQMWVQNEDTAQLPDRVDRRSFSELLSIAEPAPKSPAESMACIQVRPGFEIELVASEPLIVDPVAFDWGPDGKFWVVEMRDYPMGMDGHGKPGGVIKYLEDTDGDGHYDKATVFLEGVRFPNGVMAWGKGVLVSAAPDIFYAEDTDGDGKADVRRVLLTGFNQGNQQHRINGFEYGLDNWVYAANGDSGGTVSSPSNGKSANLRGRDLKFKPDSGEFELIEGQTQFGRRRDDWGNWFGNENPTWLWHYAVPERYLRRNPGVAPAEMRHVLANYPDSSRVFPVSRPQQRFNWPNLGNGLTSANSATPYRDVLFGAEFTNSVFISEPAQNVVHREVLEPDGVTYSSHRAAGEENREFLASTDNWFRPTMLKTGPDGALYIADMYRLVIEHPEYFPQELKNRPDLRAGEDKGRIYRIRPAGVKLRAVPNLAKLSVSELVQRLGSASGWERDTAQRLLVHGKEKPAAADLIRLGKDSPNPKVRLQVLCTLEGLGLLTPAIVSGGLVDNSPAVRETAVRLSEPFLAKSGTVAATPESLTLKIALLKLVDDPSVRVRYQLAFSLGEWRDRLTGQALAALALKHSGDASIQTAVLSSVQPQLQEFIDALFSSGANGGPPAKLVAQLVGMSVAGKDQGSLTNILARLAPPANGDAAPWQLVVFAGFLDALNSSGSSFSEFQRSANPRTKGIVENLTRLFAQARAWTAPDRLRIDVGGQPAVLMAIPLLGRGPDGLDADVDRLASLLQPQIGIPVQQAALAQLGRLAGPMVGRVLLDSWKSSSPSMRIDVLNTLLRRTDWAAAFLDRVESGAIAPSEIAPSHQQNLLKNSDESVREQARRVFASRNSNRQELVIQYASVGGLTGDPAHGLELYRQHCSTCHRLRGEGNNVGPDLTTVADKPAGMLVVAILDPNQAFEAKYINYTAVLKDGREISGIIATETPNSLTLRGAGGKDEVILRQDLRELNSSHISTMPEGFEAALKPQDIADLIAGIRGVGIDRAERRKVRAQ